MIRRARGNQFAREFLFGSVTSAPSAFESQGPVVEYGRSARADGAAPRNRISSVMVPLDGTPDAEHALPYALASAARFGAGIWLVHVHSRLDGIEPWQYLASAETARRRLSAKYDYLSDTARRIAMATGRCVGTHVIDDFDTEESLCRAAQNCDLVVMSARRRGLLSRLLRYDVADGVRRRTNRPVLLVPRPAEFAAGSIDLATAPPLANVLVPLDGTVRAEAALPPARRFVEAFAGELTLLNVEDPARNLGVFEHTTPTGYLRAVADECVRDEVPTKAYKVTTRRSVVDAVIDFAERRRADLIAVAPHRENAWSRWFGRGVAASLMRKLPLPVLFAGAEPTAERSEVTTVVE